MRKENRFESVINEVHRMSENYFDETIPVADMEFNSLKNIWIAGSQFEVLPSAQRLFANRLRVPYSYLARCPEELQAHNLNYWVQQEVEKRETLFCRFDGDKLRALFTDRYKAIDHMEILSQMLEYGFNPDIEVHYSLDQNLLVLKVPDFTRTFGFGGDDIVPGISIANSEVGILSFSIEAYFYRLICSNGLISKTSVASRFKHVSRRALDEFPHILRQVINESEHNQRRFEISTQTHLDNPLATIGTFNSQFQITKKEAEAIQTAWILEEGYTMFNVINAYTRAAKDESLSAEESYKLERIGGLILSMVKQ
ncbi:MAG: DUF932 domain-containing protein [Deltaproteobacteria bacterium]|nr:DUF932 domain-containing protein [Deltaproteobacteria bacterium]